MTDPFLSQQLRQIVDAPGIVEIVVRVAPPADNWLLDIVTPSERDAIQLKYFKEQLEKLRTKLKSSHAVQATLTIDRGEASVSGTAKTLYELVRPGGVLERDSQLQVLARVRFGKLSGEPRHV